MRHVSEVLVPRFGRPVLLCRARCLGPVGRLHTFEMVTEHFADPNLSVVVGFFRVLRVCGMRQNHFATVSGFDQLVVGPTHARGRTLDLLMTDVPDLVRVAVVAPIGNSDHSSLSAIISMAEALPNLCVSLKVFLKHQVNWNTVYGAIQELPRRNIGFLTILLRF